TLFSIFAIALIITFVSCEDDNDIVTSEISNISSMSAYPLDVVTLEGTNFDSVLFAFVGNRQANFEVNGTSLQLEIPANAEGGSNKITLALADNSRVSIPLTVLIRPIPVFQRITPSAALPGEEVTILGTSLDNLESVTVGEVEATVVSSSATELVFTVPDGLPPNLPAVIGVVTQGGSTESTSTFYVGENLLANGELEEGSGDDFTNWNKFNGPDLLTATTNADQAYAGRSLRAVGFGGDAWRTQFASDAAATVIGDEYTLYMWIRAQAGT